MQVNEDALAGAGTAHLMQSSFNIEFSLSVADGRGLWAAAAEKGLAAPGATLDDVYELIGPAEDPDLSACLTMLAAPSAIAGCRLHDFEITEVKADRIRSVANDRTAMRAAMDASA